MKERENSVGNITNKILWNACTVLILASYNITMCFCQYVVCFVIINCGCVIIWSFCHDVMCFVTMWDAFVMMWCAFITIWGAFVFIWCAFVIKWVAFVIMCIFHYVMCFWHYVVFFCHFARTATTKSARLSVWYLWIIILLMFVMLTKFIKSNSTQNSNGEGGGVFGPGSAFTNAWSDEKEKWNTRITWILVHFLRPGKNDVSIVVIVTKQSTSQQNYPT